MLEDENKQKGPREEDVPLPAFDKLAPSNVGTRPHFPTDVPSTMPLRGREEDESEIRPRSITRCATKGGHASRLTPALNLFERRVHYSQGRRDETELHWCVKPESQAG